MSLKALIITGDKVQDHEFIYPYYRLQEDNYTVDVATKDGPLKEIFGYYGTKIPVTKSILELDYIYDVLILPGGAKAMEYMRQESDIIDYIGDYSEGHVIGSICHGAQLLISAGLVKDKLISGYYSIKDDIINAGGVYSDEAFITNKNGDSVIISSPHYKYLGPWMREVLYQVRVNTL
jgi:protease I